jgi:hypothetical protein
VHVTKPYFCKLADLRAAAAALLKVQITLSSVLKPSEHYGLLLNENSE